MKKSEDDNGSQFGDYSVVHTNVDLGRECKFDAGCYVGPGAKLGDWVRVGPHAVIDSRTDQRVEIRDGAVIGAQSIVQAGVLIGDRAVVEPGAVVTRNVPAMAVVAGNPAKIVRYVAGLSTPAALRAAGEGEDLRNTGVRGVNIHRLPLIEDLRGNLVFGEAMKHVPFAVKRFFVTFEVASEEARGEHAHRKLEQFLLCVHGRVNIVVDDGKRREEIILDRPNVAIHIRPMVWGVQYRFSPGAVLLVLCSDLYDPTDYIRDYSEFLELSGPDSEIGEQGTNPVYTDEFKMRLVQIS